MLDRAQQGWNSGNELPNCLTEPKNTALGERGSVDDKGSSADNVIIGGTEFLDLITEAIIVRDLEGKILYWNSVAEGLFGWMRDEVVGRNMHQILKTRFSTSLEEIDATILLTGCWEGNLVEQTKDGREITVACRKALKEDRTTSQQIVLESKRDVTAQLEAEEELRRIERLAAMGSVAGMIAHEINNPLAAITNIFFLLAGHPSLDKEARYYASLAEDGLERISHITRQTLSLYRDAQKPIPLSVPAILDDVLESQLVVLRRQEVKLGRSYRAQKHIFGLPAELKQLFLNLIENAIQAMPRGGGLRVSLRESWDARMQRRGIRVNVTDTGTGIRPEHAKRLFEPFFTTKSVKGAGLGLWSSRVIAQKYGGSIRFRSLRLNQRSATCFSVFLPGVTATTGVEAEPRPRAQQWKVRAASA